MRRISGLLLVALVWSTVGFSKEKDSVEPAPVFMDPDFHFSQVSTICLAPGLDLRADKTEQLFLSERGPGPGFEHSASADQYMAGVFGWMGYQTTECRPVTATLADLRAPSEEWLRSLDFGQSNWLFVLAVEDVRAKCGWIVGAGGMWGETCALVSGVLFEKRSDAVRMVWRDRVAGTPLILGGGLIGRKHVVEATEASMAVNDGVERLVEEFEVRSKKHPLWLFAVDEESFSANCDAVWTALNDAFGQDPKKYKVPFSDATDKMALYAFHHKTMMQSVDNENHVVLKARGSGCVMQITESFTINHHRETDDWSDLTNAMGASLPK